MASSVAGWSFPPHTSDLLRAQLLSCCMRSFLRCLAQWAYQHGVCQQLAAAVSMPLEKQIRGSDGCWNRFWQISNVSSNWKLLLEVVLSGASCRNSVSVPLGALLASFHWHLWTLATKGWGEGQQRASSPAVIVSSLGRKKQVFLL